MKILNPQIFLDKSEKNGSDFLVQLAGQISENNIQKFLVGSQFPKFKNQIQIPEIFQTFFVGRIKPRGKIYQCLTQLSLCFAGAFPMKNSVRR